MKRAKLRQILTSVRNCLTSQFSITGSHCWAYLRGLRIWESFLLRKSKDSIVKYVCLITKCLGVSLFFSVHTAVATVNNGVVTPSYMCCINFSLPKVIITTISGRGHTIFPSLMPWTTVTSYLG